MKQQEHPKNMIEVIENTRSAVEGYATSQKISEEMAALLLILNELRCIHWHFDIGLKEKDKAGDKESL